jgi:hypothetical protein
VKTLNVRSNFLLDSIVHPIQSVPKQSQPFGSEQVKIMSPGFKEKSFEIVVLGAGGGPLETDISG